MKILLLCPSSYTLNKTLSLGFGKLSHNIKHYDFRESIKSWQRHINTQIYRLPFKYREKWEDYYFPFINKEHKRIFEQVKPDIVFVYNNEMLLPETVNYFKQNKAKIIFLLGDSPYYTPTNRYYLHLLFKADLIVSPDSMWAEQLKLLGIKNIIIDFPGFDDTYLNHREPAPEEREKYNFDIFFVGTGYPDLWGYKRALFASKFSKLNLKVYGSKHWVKWLEFFPELQPKFELQKYRISDEQLVIMSKCAKVYPVDANPAILNGVHLRIFDCIAHGVLPLAEYRKDQEVYFKQVDLPIIKDYTDAEQVAVKYINNDQLRENTLRSLQQYLIENYSADVVIRRIINEIK